MNYSDQEIVALLSSEDRVHYGFNVLTNMYKERVYWVVRRMVLVHEDADDVVQEVFIKVWKNISSFKGDSKLYTWVYRIAVNEALSFLRKKRKRFFVPLVDVEAQLATFIDEGIAMSGDDIDYEFQKALLKLPEKQRMVFNLKYFEEMKYKDIAEVMEVSEGALKAQYHHAVKKIKEILSTH